MQKRTATPPAKEKPSADPQGPKSNQPPDDHEGFLAARKPGLRAIRAALEKRRKKA